ncbi:MAG: TonB-dependent receptor plug domain-containing protein, partial [Gemmatimonadales bacterium]
AGVSVRRTGGGTAVPQVRGSAPEEVLVLLDGIPLNDPLTGRADLARVSVADVASVTLLPGVQTARTGGRAMAGVIEVTTRSRVTPELSSDVGSYGAWGSRGGASIGALSVSAEVDHLADGYPATAPGGEPTERENAGGTVWSALVRGRGALDLTLRANGADRGLPGSMTNPSLTGSGSDRALLAAIRREGAVSWSITGQWVEARSADPDAPPRNTSYDVTTRSAGGSAALASRWPLALGGWSGEATVAADGRYDRFTGDGVAVGADFARAGARTGVELAAGPWTFSPVVRMDIWSRAGGGGITGRFDAGWHHAGTSASLGVGSGITPPVPFDLLFREGVGVALNSGLRPERVVWEATADLRQAGSWFGVPGTLSLSGFIGRVDDFVTWAAGANFVWSPQNVNIRRQGGELALELRPGERISLTGGVSVSVVNFAAAPWLPVAYRPRDSERAGLSWTPAGWRFDLGWRRLGRRPQYNNGYFNLPAIGLWDLGAERRLSRAFLLRIDGRDLTDRRPEYVAGLPLPGRTVALTLTYSVP